MRVAIIGCPGSGKSTLALKLAKKAGLPLYHLDQYFWKPGWQRPDRAKFEKVHHDLCDKDMWIIEGMATRHFDYRAARADVIIFLDVPLYRCLYRVFKRAFLCWGQVRDSSAQGCPDRFPSLEFLSYIWKFNQKQKPDIKVLLKKYKDQKEIFIIRSQADIERCMQFFG